MNTAIVSKLIINDFMVYKKSHIGMTLYILALLIFSVNNMGENIAGAIVSIGMMLCVSSTSVFLSELKTNPLTLVASLPVSRKEIFTARLVSSFVLFVVNLMLWVLCLEVLRYFSVIADQTVFSLKTIVMLTVVALFHWSIFYLIHYRMRFMATALLYLSSLFIPVFMVIKFWRTKSSMVSAFVEGDLQLVGIPFLVVSIFYIASVRASLKYFKSKDL
ncbi:MAG: ABC-2 transporter permease [Cyclobacteriaceae bacterium]|nr:ABC-2 transporter permease [Cyclobacteriaceae bacterium HetDA_MAG_MS6]